MSGHEQFDEDVAVYALGALSGDDRRTFEAHLATCEACQKTLAEFARVSAGIGLSTEPVEPPADLRSRTLARAVAQPQDRTGRVVGTIGVTVPAASSVAKEPPVPAPSRAASHPSWLALAAALVCVIGLGAYAWSLRSQLWSAQDLIGAMSRRVETLREELFAARRDSATLSHTIDVLRAPEMLKVDLKGQGAAPAAVGRAFVSAEKGLVLSVGQLPRLGPNRTYQLWVIPAGSTTPVSAGLFDADAAGTSTVTVPVPQGVTVVAGLTVAVTDEPRGGSLQPTTTPFLAGVTN